MKSRIIKNFSNFSSYMKMPPLSETQQDDDLNEAYTEDTLIDSMTNSETLSSTSTWEKSESREYFSFYFQVLVSNICKHYTNTNSFN